MSQAIRQRDYYQQVWGGTNSESVHKIEEFVHSPYFKDLPVVSGAREVLEALKVCQKAVLVISPQHRT